MRTLLVYILGLVLMVHNSAFAQGKFALDSMLQIAENEQGRVSVQAYNELSRRLISNDPSEAMQYSLKALEKSLKINYRDGVGNAFNNIGVFYKNQGLYANALNYYTKAYDIFLETQNQKGEAFALSNLATIHSLSKNYDVALENYLHAFRIMKSLGLTEDMVGVLNNLGNIYKERNEDFRAIKIYEEALKLSGTDSSKIISDPLINIGNIHFERGENDKALENYKSALQIETRNRDKAGMALCYLNMALIYKKQNRIDHAIDYLQRAKLSALDVNAKPVLKEICHQLSMIYEGQGQMSLAYENMQAYGEIIDELYEEQLTKSVKDIDVSYSLIKSEEEYERIRLRSLQSRIKDTNIESFFIIGVMAMIVLIALIFILYKLRRERSFYSR